MYSLFSKMRYRLKGFTFMESVQNELLNKVLGHSKTIGYEQGCPVFSIFYPAIMSAAYRQYTTSLLLGMMRNKTIPATVNFAITDECDNHCSDCYFNRQKKIGKQLLTTKEIKTTIQKATAMGVSTLVLVGGEPLIHPDIIEIVKCINTKKLNLFMFTNGNRLAEMAMPLKKAGLNRVFVSLQYPDAERHDQFTQHPGSYENVLKGINAAKKGKMLVGISAKIAFDTTPADLERMFLLGHEMGVAEFYVTKIIDPNYPKVSFDPEQDEYYQIVQKFNQNKKYKFGILYYPYTSSYNALGGCSAGGNRFYITPYGEVTPCDLVRVPFGNAKEDDLNLIWHKITSYPEMGTVFGPCRVNLVKNTPMESIG